MIEIIVNFVIFFIVIAGSLIFVMRLKNVSKGYRIFFATYILFWIPLKMLREYTSVLQNQIDASIVWLPLMVYGLVGIFIRPFVDYIAMTFRSRKLILYSAVIIGIISFIPISIQQTTLTNTIQSIGVGVGASMIGTYELMFKEQYTKNRSFLTVLIMAFPPLIADFIAAPVQSIIKVYAVSQANNYTFILSLMWTICIFINLIVILVLVFVKENRMLIGLARTNNKIQTNSTQLSFFGLLCIVGFLIAFVKFSNSGAIATLTIENMAKNLNITNEVSSIQAYTSSLFSFSQLLGTLFVSLFLIKKTNKITAFSVGIGIWIVFELTVSFINNPFAYFAVSSLNGFGYGILYNLVLAYVLALSFDKKKLKNGVYKIRKISPMGIYQAVLSTGIAFSSFYTTYLKTVLVSNNSYMIVNLSILAFIVCLEIMYYVVYVLDKRSFVNTTLLLQKQIETQKL